MIVAPHERQMYARGIHLEVSPRATLRKRLLILLRVPLALHGTQTGPLEPVINSEHARTLLTDAFEFVMIGFYVLGEDIEGLSRQMTCSQA